MIDTTSSSRTMSKDFLSILDLDPIELVRLLDLARDVKRDRALGRQAPTRGALAGSHVAMLFEKPSLRTRSTFEIAIRELGGETLHIPPEMAEGTREPLEDVARNLERWVRALVVRTFAQQKAETLAASASRLHVINALTDEQHPCQALADFLTLREHWGTLRGRTVAYVGDGNNVAASLAHAGAMLGVTVHVASPAGYELPDRVLDEAARVARDGACVRRFRDPRRAVAGADAVYTDVWASMGQEDEAAERRLIFSDYQVNEGLMAAADAGALFMHCLPAHRGEEVAAEVIDSSRSVIYDEAENRLHVQGDHARSDERPALTDSQTRHTRGLLVVILLGVIFFTILALIILKTGGDPAEPARRLE
ncbi:MAG TPA: ornithine carbamoyltransferase, partial [Thermoanaerobaculia bacterium]|nr:ornithine carbamoyltransferase [Thermoanaerobaculia bacterium]